MIIDEISFEQIMERWAFHCRHDREGSLGYPSRTIEGRLQAEGGVLPTTGRIGGWSVDIEFMTVERIMRHIRSAEPEWTQVVEDRYLWERDWKTVAASAHCSVRTAQRWFNKARREIMTILMLRDVEERISREQYYAQ